MKKIQLFLILGLLITCYPLYAQKEIVLEKRQSLSIGETIEFHSKILNESRVLNIYLPNSYSKNSEKDYPVVYLLDGAIEEDFIHISGLVQFASFSWVKMMPESIVVGIPNTNRNRDFTFPSNNSKDTKDLDASGESERFIRFIEKELQPIVDYVRFLQREAGIY